MSNRIMRINDEILRECAKIIHYDLEDPRIGIMTTVVRVDTTTDLKYCKIYVSIFGDKDKKNEGLQALKDASKYIRKLLAARINLRNTPEIKFILDDSLDHSMKMDQIFKDLKENQGENHE